MRIINEGKIDSSDKKKLMRAGSELGELIIRAIGSEDESFLKEVVNNFSTFFQDSLANVPLVIDGDVVKGSEKNKSVAKAVNMLLKSLA